MVVIDTADTGQKISYKKVKDGGRSLKVIKRLKGPKIELLNQIYYLANTKHAKNISYLDLC